MNRADYLGQLKHNVDLWERRMGLNPSWPRDSLVMGACRAFLADFIHSDSMDVQKFYLAGQFAELRDFLAKLNPITLGIAQDYLTHFVSQIQVKETTN